MGSREDMNWDLIGSMLAAESSGKSPRLFASRRSLFGIPSALDEEMARLERDAQEISPKRPPSGDACDEETLPENGFEGATAEEVRESAAPSDAAPCRGSAAASGTEAAGRKRAVPARIEHPFAPVFDANSRVLILGTIPSPKSRETGFYYNHPRNRFWSVLAALFDEETPAANDEKRAFALRHGIALWDVLAQCEIEGAKDSSIAHCVPNDIDYVLGNAPVEAVFCTGNKATELYRKYCLPHTQVEARGLPSTSPANAAASLEDLIAAYRVITDYTL